MKNMKKLAAGFIAAAMAMTMSLSAFADVVVPTISTDKTTLNIGTGITTVNGAQTTMMAYVVPGLITEVANAPAYDEDVHEIVALDQVDGATGIASVPVDANKLADGKTIVVKISGTDGNLATYLITMQAPVVTYSVTFDYNGGTGAEANSKTFDDDDTIAEVVAGVVPTKEATSTEKYEFAGWATTADGDVIVDTTVPMKSLLAEGATSITLYAKYTATAVTQPVIVVIGDVNGDNVVTATDANFVKAYVNAANQETYNVVNGKEIGVTIVAGVVIGDVNGDNVVTATDANFIKAYVNAANQETYNSVNGKEIGVTKQYTK